jgi:hypothetical protein
VGVGKAELRTTEWLAAAAVRLLAVVGLLLCAQFALNGPL